MRNLTKFTNTKIIASGNVIEVYLFNNRQSYNREPELENSSGIGLPRKILPEDKKLTNRMRSMYRAKGMLTRLINSNNSLWKDNNGNMCTPIFLTLTFAENIQNTQVANDEFTKFVKRVTYRVTGLKSSFLKYVTVVEFQKRGAVHFHSVFFNLPKSMTENERKNRNIARLWSHGFVEVKAVNNVGSLGTYVTKYMNKGFDDPRMDGEKRYYRSRGLIEPIVIMNSQNTKKLISQLPDDSLKHTREIEHDFMGKFTYKLYILPVGQTLQDLQNLSLHTKVSE